MVTKTEHNGIYVAYQDTSNEFVLLERIHKFGRRTDGTRGTFDNLTDALNAAEELVNSHRNYAEHFGREFNESKCRASLRVLGYTVI